MKISGWKLARVLISIWGLGQSQDVKEEYEWLEAVVRLVKTR